MLIHLDSLENKIKALRIDDVGENVEKKGKGKGKGERN
jgi:stalled ribosome alternative rescue factor ArfA